MEAENRIKQSSNQREQRVTIADRGAARVSQHEPLQQTSGSERQIVTDGPHDPNPKIEHAETIIHKIGILNYHIEPLWQAEA